MRKKILSLILCFCLIIPCFFSLTACGDKEKKPEGQSSVSAKYIDQTYTGYKQSDRLLEEPQTQDVRYEADVVSVKIKKDGKVLLVYDLWIYEGVYQENTAEGYNIKITLTEDGINYKVLMTINENDTDSALLKDDIATENTLIGTTGIILNVAEDVLFDDGLYVGLGSYSAKTDSYSSNIESGSYTLKLSNNEIYSSDSVQSANKILVDKIGNNLVYKAIYDRAGESLETNLFFVEKKGEHSQEFVEFFGDLDYVIYHCELEQGVLNRYYSVKASSQASTLEIEENITFNTSKLFKIEYIDGSAPLYTIESINLQLTLNKNGSVVFIATNNDKYNCVSSGKWYNIGKDGAQGVLVKLTDDTFFDGLIALGVYEDENVTFNHFKENAESYIDETDSVRYLIGWTENSESNIENGHVWG